MTDTLGDGDVAALRDWVREQGIGSQLTDVTPLAGGTQNIVVRLRIDGRPMVLRRPPEHPRPTSNKTMRHRVGLHFAESLALLGNAPWEGSELAAIKRPGSFVARQVPQWRGMLDTYRRQDGYPADSLPGADELADWLAANRPADSAPGIMHGDVHLNNVLLRRDRPEVAAFVDWEMCTVGDPLLDLGWLLICWPVDPDPLGVGAPLAALGGLATRQELLDAYLGAGGRSTAHLNWYQALACFKLGVVLEGSWVRMLAGQAIREVGERLHASARRLIELGSQVAEGKDPFG